MAILSTAVRSYDCTQPHSAPLNAYRTQRLYYQSMSHAEQAEHRSATAVPPRNGLLIFLAYSKAQTICGIAKHSHEPHTPFTTSSNPLAIIINSKKHFT